jgi:hypothetical protein
MKEGLTNYLLTQMQGPRPFAERVVFREVFDYIEEHYDDPIKILLDQPTTNANQSMADLPTITKDKQ